MADSRRYETRYKVFAHREFTDIGGYKFMGGNTSSLVAGTLTTSAINAPPSGYGFRTFYISYNSTAGQWYFIFANRGVKTPPFYLGNSLGAYPTSNVYWNDSAWGRCPGKVMWYDEDTLIFINSTPNTMLTRIMTSGARTIKYSMYLSWYHQVDVRNDSTEDIVIKARGYSSHSLSGDAVGSLQMTIWYNHTVPAGQTITIGYYEPMEIKICSDSSTDAIGVTKQDGSQYLLLGDD